MNKIIEKTYEFLDYLESSNLIKELTYYKNKVNSNKELLSLIKLCNEEEDNKKIIEYRLKIYSYKEYKEYMKRYNSLYLIILKINKKYKELTGEKSCSN